MKQYAIGLVPGPVSVPEEFRRAYLENFGSADLEEEFFLLYEENESLLRKLLKTNNAVTIQSTMMRAAPCCRRETFTGPPAAKK